MNFDTWLETYKPIVNPKDDTMYWESFGNDLIELKKHKLHNIWTLIEEDGKEYIVNGIRLINRISFILTKQAWKKNERFRFRTKTV